MSSVKQHQNSRVVAYNRKASGKTAGKVPANQTNKGFWDFLDSSDEEAPIKRTTVQSPPVTPDKLLKRKAVEVIAERLSKKTQVAGRVRSRSSTPVDTRKQARQTTSTEVDQKLQSPQTITPRKSNLIARSNAKSGASAPASSRQKTPQPLSTPPRPSTPKSKPKADMQTPTPPRISPKQSITPTKRAFTRVNSSPLSTPPSSHNSVSQPLAVTPRSTSRQSTRSRSFNDFSSPKMTPKQEKTWESLPITESSSPARRRLVDKLREQASRTTPEKTRTPPPIPPTFTIEEEISRVLEYKVPTFEEPPRPQRKEVSQSDSQGTYLSRSRSFLADTPMQESFPFEELWQPEPLQEMNGQEEEDSGVKSWHELKRGGEDKRLLDEMEDLIEECKFGGRLGLRRSSVLQIVEKLFNDITWRRKFKGLGLMSTFIQNVADAYSDPVCSLFLDFADDEILLLMTLLAIDLVPKPVPPTVAEEVLRLCLEGLREERNLGTLLSLRSLSVSKILKSELLSLQTQMSKSQILPGVLTSQHLSLNIVMDLRVSNILPLCKFLRDFTEDNQWTILAAIAGSLEKSTQGRVITGLRSQDIEVFNPILKLGLAEFETDGTFSSFITNFSSAAKSNLEFPSRLHQSH